MGYVEQGAGRCAVIGYGSWATAIVKTLTTNGRHVAWHVLNDTVLDSLRREGRNARYLPYVNIDRQMISPSKDIDEVVAQAETVVLATPSAFLKEVLSPLTRPLAGKTVVSAVKGIIPGDYLTVAEYMHSRYSVPFDRLGVMTGPSHAEEVGIGRLSYLTVACADSRRAESIGEMIANDYIRCSFTDDVLGVEYAAILKNVYAIAVGMAVGMGYGDNFLAVLIANCAREMTRFLDRRLPCAGRNTSTAAYLGDLLVTCYSPLSRNRRLGNLIGRGCSVKSALNEMTMIAEGYYAAECVRHTGVTEQAEMPVADMVYDVLYRGRNARESMAALTMKLI